MKTPSGALIRPPTSCHPCPYYWLKTSNDIAWCLDVMPWHHMTPAHMAPYDMTKWICTGQPIWNSKNHIFQPGDLDPSTRHITTLWKKLFGKTWRPGPMRLNNTDGFFGKRMWYGIVETSAQFYNISKAILTFNYSIYALSPLTVLYRH